MHVSEESKTSVIESAATAKTQASSHVFKQNLKKPPNSTSASQIRKPTTWLSSYRTSRSDNQTAQVTNNAEGGLWSSYCLLLTNITVFLSLILLRQHAVVQY